MASSQKVAQGPVVPMSSKNRLVRTQFVEPGVHCFEQDFVGADKVRFGDEAVTPPLDTHDIAGENTLRSCFGNSAPFFVLEFEANLGLSPGPETTAEGRKLSTPVRHERATFSEFPQAPRLLSREIQVG